MVVFTLQYDFSLNCRRKEALFMNFDCWIEPASQNDKNVISYWEHNSKVCIVNNYSYSAYSDYL